MSTPAVSRVDRYGNRCRIVETSAARAGFLGFVHQDDPVRWAIPLEFRGEWE